MNNSSIKAEKRLGIWMDHSNAHVIPFSADRMEELIISTKFTHEEKENSLRKSENLMHNKEQHQQSSFYKQIIEEIKNNDHVILFGPTNAKLELANLLKADHHFSKIKIDVLQADKMTEGQKYAFVKEYFVKHL